MESIAKHFGILFHSPAKVDRLRHLVLQLAVSGRLVPQHPNDEPVSVLLEKIEAEKERLVREKKIKKQKKLPPIANGEVPHELPEGWKWVRLGSIAHVIGGGTPKTNLNEYWVNGDVPWLTPADLHGIESKYVSRGRRNITELGLKKSSARLLPKGTVLFSSRAPIGYVAIAKNDLATNQGFKSCVPYEMEMNEDLYYVLMWDTDRINDNASGTTFKEVSGTKVSRFLVPLPPLNEGQVQICL